MSDVMDDPDKKAAYLNSVELRPGDLWPMPYYAHLDNLVHEAAACPDHKTPEFRLFNRWEAEYVQDKMHEVCPGRKYRMRWHFGGRLKEETRP